MYLNLIQPFINFTQANVETFARFAKSPEIAKLTRSNIEDSWRITQEHLSRVTQSDAFSEWTKSNVDNFSRFAQEYSRTFYTLASETQSEVTRGLQAGTRRLQQVANRSSNILSVSAEAASKAVQNTAEEVADETEEKVKTARRRS